MEQSAIQVIPPLCVHGFQFSPNVEGFVLTLGHAYLSSTPLAVSAQPYLDRMSEQLHEACNMATLEGDDILYIARSATTQRLISVDLSVGGRLPAYCTSMGRILLAALDDASLQDYLDHADLQTKTSRTLTTPEALFECLQQVRQQGWCIVDQELEQGLRSIAVPVYDASGQVLAALNVSTHAGRVSRSELEPHHFRDQHRHGLAEHGGFGFDPAHTPAQYAEAIDHGLWAWKRGCQRY